MNKPQVIRDDTGRPAFAVIPWKEFEALVGGDAETMLSDEELYDLALAAGGEAFPSSVVDRLLSGENPVRVHRLHRGMTQAALAAEAGISAIYMSQIETGKRTGSTKTLSAIAAALDIDLDDLV